MGKQQHFRLGPTAAMFVISIAALGLSLWIFDAEVRRGLTLVAAVIVIGAMQSAFQPLLRLISRKLGLPGIALVCLISSSLLVWLAIGLVPGIGLRSTWDGLFISWLYALFVTVAQWVLVSRSDEIFLNEIVRTSGKHTRAAGPPQKPGCIFIQMDGVSAPLLDWQLKAGNLPNIARLISDEHYIFDGWRAQLPATTPASQAGILFGSNRDIPGFRWYDRQTGTIIVANEPKGAAIMESRHSQGNGLLADGGVSVGNLFSGDAKTNIMVMSKLTGDRESVRHMDEYTAYFSSPFGYMRSIILAVGEVIKEVYQAHRQVALDMKPRISRRMQFIVQRVATNVLLRHLQTYIVVKNMLDGVNRLYVDFLDYDEIAHHAGIARPESLAALAGIDSTIGVIARARQYATRPYHIVLVSDHGQSQGPTFRQLNNGHTLEDFVADYTAGNVFASTDPVETTTVSAQPTAVDKTATTIVASSGNLGGVWFKELPGQATYESITKQYPGFIKDLLTTQGIGLILVASAAGQHLCISAQGAIILETAKPLDPERFGAGNPLAPYQYADLGSLLRLVRMQSAPDLMVMAAYDQNSGETYAFEELVGNHGGYGGWQTEAVLLHPPELQLPARYRNQTIIGAENLHKILKHWADTAPPVRTQLPV